MHTQANGTRDWNAIVARLQADGELIPISEAARLCPANQSRRGYCSVNALLNWILKGKRGIFLDALRVSGKTWWTSREALGRFWATVSSFDARRRQQGAIESPAASERLQAVREREAAEIRKRIAGA